jgi:hypothetical protein
MKSFVAGLVFSVVALAFASGARADDPTVVTPEDAVPFKVDNTDVVRLTAKGISGSDFQIKIVAGPAKVDATWNVSNRVNGKHPIGTVVKEYDIKPTDKGKVKLKITVTPPNGKPVETDYEFDVQ